MRFLLMNYSEQEVAETLLEKGVLNLDLDQIAELFAGFFGKNEPEKPEKLEAKVDLPLKIIVIKDLAVIEEPQIYSGEKIDLKLLTTLAESEERSIAARVLTSIRRFVRKGKSLRPYQEVPSEEAAVELYNSAIGSFESGRINHPWDYRRSFGQKSFRLLESYLRERGLINSIASAKEAEKILCGSI